MQVSKSLPCTHSSSEFFVELFGMLQFSLAVLALVAIYNTGIDAKPPSKIVNGKRVDITEAPYIVMIRENLRMDSNKGLICAGSIISNRHILTAAHCLEEEISDILGVFHYSWLRVVAGEGSYQPGVGAYEIVKAYVHPNFTGDVTSTLHDRADIAVLELKDEIPLTSTQIPIELASENPAPDSIGLILGWGYTRPGIRAFSRTLQGSLQKVYDFDTCIRIDPEFYFVKDELCVIGSPGTVFCEGDSGGPLIVNGKLSGVVSNSYGCGSTEPGAVSNIAYHKLWIEAAVKGTAESKELPFSP